MFSNFPKRIVYSPLQILVKLYLTSLAIIISNFKNAFHIIGVVTETHLTSFLRVFQDLVKRVMIKRMK